MTDYLTDEWFATAAERVSQTPLDSAEPVSFSYHVTDIPDSHPHSGTAVSYRIDLAGGGAELRVTDEPGDVRFTIAYPIAQQVADGSLSGSRAFLDGSIRVGGDVSLLISRAGELKALNGALGATDA
ncbi:MAG: hypothetical protein HKN24_04235 [Acidimicrobiales bacterium]|nr:hypothetical protein [Acidimicrobiales bacterium]